ncbi:DctP family TRAP transporter solute-binding subunit [Paenibacillus caseinilyticus]|uniref:C4-dicarboxylate ABC transporter substrate-binding protein n=1 Tax=Paenibacillus mucilaginosus K02 TaxID=997761 RepID=I0BST6_9BACL|nr:DctP family TRAP transporter solute-binding subunit [Paenibacillus mucilaginosus]AFH65433.1 C4-dicarboxylate ABC transporter substrate-binding protein [Paenibacillus mucilaginosus K02]AFK65436.1 putative C4-dicarboxylate ABC transporter substrate binding protein [Paenibacillus mucilaginosus K02]WFA21553.1 DctP family TRAP transporter solute-binding subunit [Paenibacillus mucilaginosus]
MRPLFGTLLMVLTGVAAALVIGFYPAFLTSMVVEDDEQLGFHDKIVIQFSHVVAENTPKGLAAQDFARRVKEKAGGRIKVEVFPNGVLYNETNEVEALMNGEIQMIAPALSNISERVPAWQLFDLPYAFLSEKAVDEAFHGEIGRLLNAKLEDEHMVGLTFWSNGFKHMTSNRGPIVHPGDLSGQRFRVLPSRVIEAQFSLLGASVIPIPFNNTYQAMETGMVDGGENTVSNIHSKKFYEVQKHMTLTAHAYLGYAVLVNEAFWKGIPSHEQSLIREALEETSAWANRNAQEMNASQLRELERYKGIRIHRQTAEERLEWIKAMEPLYRDFEGVIGTELMNQVRALQTKYGGG